MVSPPTYTHTHHRLRGKFGSEVEISEDWGDSAEHFSSTCGDLF